MAGLSDNSAVCNIMIYFIAVYRHPCVYHIIALFSSGGSALYLLFERAGDRFACFDRDPDMHGPIAMHTESNITDLSSMVLISHGTDTYRLLIR